MKDNTKLKKAMDGRSISVVAKKAGMKRHTLNYILHYESREPNEEEKKQLARALNKNAEEIF